MSESEEEQRLNEYREWQKQLYGDIITSHKFSNDNVRGYILNQVDNTIVSDIIANEEKDVNIYVDIITLQFTKGQFITTCFKVSGEGSSAIYAYLYSVVKTGKPYTIKSNIIYQIDDERYIENCFVVWGPTYTSQDGEFRGFINVHGFVRLAEVSETIFDMAEEHIVRKLKDDKINFQVDICYPDNVEQPVRDVYEEYLSDNRTAIQLYVLNWIYANFRLYNASLPPHTNLAYRKIVCNKDDQLTMIKIMDTPHSTIYITDMIRENEYFLQEYKLGQKAFVVSFSEMLNIGHIEHKVWAEIEYSKRITLLRSNFISPHVPIISDWFMLANTHAGIYDNMAMHERYQQNKIAHKIVQHLDEADKLTYSEEPRKSKHISDIFEDVSDSIYDAAELAGHGIGVANVSVVLPIEHVGETMRTVSTLYDRKNDEKRAIGDMFAKLDHMQGRMFEYIYTLYCINKRIGLFHSDLHINNIAIKSTNYKPKQNHHTCYLVDGKPYLIPQAYIRANILDFSRAIPNDEFVLDWCKRKNKQLSDRFYKNRTKQTMKCIRTYLPDLYAKHHQILRIACIHNYDAVFKACTALDTYSIFSNMLMMFTHDPQFQESDKSRKELFEELYKHDLVEFLLTRVVNATPVSKEVMAWVTDITKFSEHLAIDTFEKLLKAPTDRNVITTFEWPNYIILTKFFERFHFTEKNIPKDRIDAPIIRMIYSSDHKIEWSYFNEYTTLTETDLGIPPFTNKAIRYKLLGHDIPQPLIIRPENFDYGDALDTTLKIAPSYMLPPRE